LIFWLILILSKQKYWHVQGTRQLVGDSRALRAMQAASSLIQTQSSRAILEAHCRHLSFGAAHVHSGVVIWLQLTFFYSLIFVSSSLCQNINVIFFLIWSSFFFFAIYFVLYLFLLNFFFNFAPHHLVSFSFISNSVLIFLFVVCLFSSFSQKKF